MEQETRHDEIIGYTRELEGAYHSISQDCLALMEEMVELRKLMQKLKVNGVSIPPIMTQMLYEVIMESDSRIYESDAEKAIIQVKDQAKELEREYGL